MRQRIAKSPAWLTCLALFIGSTGCAVVGDVPRAGRAPAEREKLIDPGKLGSAQDGRRGFLNFWNEQILREDVKVGTVFLGDSITELWDLHAYFAGSDGVIENRGVSGDMAWAMARRFEADVVQLRPRNVVILAGTNDVSSYIKQGKTDEEIVQLVTASNESMMDAGRKAGIHVLVCSILPTNSDFVMHGDRTYLRARINERLKAACAAKGCIYVDYAAATSDAKGDLRKELARDGLHPHYAGYAIMARLVKEAAARNGLKL